MFWSLKLIPTFSVWCNNLNHFGVVLMKISQACNVVLLCENIVLNSKKTQVPGLSEPFNFSKCILEHSGSVGRALD